MTMPTVSYEECKVEYETDDALLIYIPEVSDDPLWVPKSTNVIDEDASEIKKTGDSGTLVVKEWWALREEWI